MIILMVPVLFVSVGWFLYEPVSLLASILLFITTLLIVVFNKKFNWMQSKLFWIPLLIPISYMISALVNSQSFSSTTTGVYQRNFGLATFTALSLLLVLSTDLTISVRKFLNYGLLSTLIMANLYGYIQVFDADPLPWANPLNAVQLTLGNPNFASALFGILSVIPLSRFIESKSKSSKLVYFILICSTIFLTYKTNSVQGIFILVIIFFLFIFLYSLSQKNIRSRIVVYLSLSMITLLILLFISTFTKYSFKLIRDKLFFETSVLQRLDYWETGLNIWRDNLIFGVGADQFQRYAAVYRKPSQILREGNFTITDKAHSVLIDHLANGGLLAATLWVSLVIMVFYVSLKTFKMGVTNKLDYITLLTIWSGYVFQSLISPDHITLAAIGYISAGLLVGQYLKTQRSVSSDNTKQSKNLFYIRAIASVLALFSIVIFSRVLIANYQANQILKGKIGISPVYLQVIETWPDPKVTELIGIETVKDPNNCQLTNQIADYLIKINDRSSQGWFMKAICANNSKDFNSAIEFVENSLKFDPINPYYLISKAKLEIAANRLEDAQTSIELAKRVNPNEPGLESVENSISTLKLQP
jgi:O-antigen ligase